jgi:hypothetical protein
MRIILLLISLFTATITYSQFQIGLFGGVSDYHGDLLDLPYKFSNAAFGVTAGYKISDRFNIRAGFLAGKIEGADSVSPRQGLPNRNLSFQSSLKEFSLRAEYNLFNIDDTRWTPYAFGGLAVFHFDPYTYDSNGEKHYLKPLSTGGQGLDQYPESKPYALTQISLPGGGGIKYAISDRVHIAAEIGLRLTFTDYLDDVGGFYPDEFDLLAARGPKAVELAYRGDERPGGNQSFPRKGASRGRSGSLLYNDFYYITGLHLMVNLGGGGGSTFAGRSGKRKDFGCPVIRP